jgi:hypothetical protein
MKKTKKPKSQTPTDILNWCDVQEEEAKKTIDMLLDNHDWNDKKIKKALQVASQILTMVDKLKQTALDAIIK